MFKFCQLSLIATNEFCWTVPFLLATSLISVCRTYSVQNMRYECGAHGKFEYCIDDIPGCVIGCHCHPGFYFDTNTKICEPNTKLIENLEQHHMAESSSLYPNDISMIESIPTATTTHALHKSGGEISKDNDDLSDWLYNQFFKTIEAEVINNTSDKPMTRRKGDNLFKSGSDGLKGALTGRKPHNSAIKRRVSKSLRKRYKKKRSDGLRRKLLRITEDDSLFDSDSDSDESDSSHNSDDFGSRSSSSNEKERIIINSTDDREHGHKKVIMFNKRPRPPLPSFIILPSMDSPYYPPIALPPPPIMPMYPMVPIPPMAPCLPFPGKTSDNTTTNLKPNKSSVDTASSLIDKTTTPSSNDSSVDALRNKKQRLKHTFSEETLLIRSGDVDTENSIDTKLAERLKVMEKLKSRLKMKNKNQPPISDDVVDELEENTPLPNSHTIAPLLSSHKSKHITQNDKKAKLKDFKYLSELIHKINQTDTNLDMKTQIDVNHDLRNLSNISPMRRHLQPYLEETVTYKNSHVPSSDDMYFMNLGRQIANLIRTTGSQLYSNRNIAKDQNDHRDYFPSSINDIRHPSHSYWERSIRSPLRKFKYYFSGLNDFRETENNLLNLENEVNTFASTVSPMTLQELENVLNTLQKHQGEMKNSKNITRQSNAILNVDLLPIKTKNKAFSESRGYAQYSPQRKNLETLNNTIQKAISANVTHYSDLTDDDLHMIDDAMYKSEDFMPLINTNQQTYHQRSGFLSVNNQIPNGNNANYYQSSNYFPIDIRKKEKLSSDKYLVHPDGKEINNMLSQFELSGKIPEMFKIHRDLAVKGSGLSENNSYISNKYIDPNKKKHPEKYLTLSMKNPDLSAKYHELPAKYHELPAKYHELPAKYHELPAKYHELPAKYHELPAKYHELPAKYHEMPAKYHELPAKYHELPAKYHELHAKFQDLSTKHHKQSAKFVRNPEIPGNYIEPPENELSKTYHELPELALKHSELPSKFPEVYAKYPKEPLKYTNVSADFSKQIRKNSQLSGNLLNPIIFDYKNSNFFSDARGKRRYFFEAAYPLGKPSHIKTFNKDTEYPSYLHHQLHHFDYFE